MAFKTYTIPIIALQANTKEGKYIVTKLTMDLSPLWKDPRKCHEGETIDRSIMVQNFGKSPTHRGLVDSPVGLLLTPLGKPPIIKD